MKLHVLYTKTKNTSFLCYAVLKTTTQGCMSTKEYIACMFNTSEITPFKHLAEIVFVVTF